MTRRDVDDLDLYGITRAEAATEAATPGVFRTDSDVCDMCQWIEPLCDCCPECGPVKDCDLHYGDAAQTHAEDLADRERKEGW